ncbi:MAG: magnesium transporter [Planctomycetaceae bacterium]|nr:MAG: magnesium transporter [Planctomycetaceae bacterium]
MVNTLLLPELREMLAQGNDAELGEFCTAMNAGRTAEFMEGLTDEQAWQVLRNTEVPRRAEIFGHFTHERQVAILRDNEPGEIAALIEELASDDRVDLLQELDKARVAEILPLLPWKDRRDIQRLQAYPEGTAGALMTTEMAKLDETLSVRQALDALASQSEYFETIYYLFIVGENDQLRGVVSARQLVSALRSPNTPLQDLIETDVVTALTTEDQESVAAKVERYNLLAIPVVDEARHLVGIITHDDIIDVVREELNADAQQMAGISPLDTDFLRINLFLLSWKRGIWLAILFFTALFTAFALKYYEDELSRFAWLAWFIPLIISSGGNSGSQSATLVITGMTSGNLKLANWRHVMAREWLVSMLLGGFVACFGMLVAWVVAPSARDALVIPITLFFVVMCGCFCGASLPMIFKRLGLDPALMSNPFVAGIVDILGIVIYLNVARILLS